MIHDAEEPIITRKKGSFNHCHYLQSLMNLNRCEKQVDSGAFVLYLRMFIFWDDSLKQKISG